MSGPEKPLYWCYVKAINHESGMPKASLKWAGSRRAILRVFTDRVTCGNWVIPLAEVQVAKLFVARQLYMKARVLMLSTGEDSYQFGMNPWANAAPHINLPIREEVVALKYSLFSIGVRVFAVLLIAALIYLD